jgi:hypothetical protein
VFARGRHFCSSADAIRCEGSKVDCIAERMCSHCRRFAGRTPHSCNKQQIVESNTSEREACSSHDQLGTENTERY